MIFRSAAGVQVLARGQSQNIYYPFLFHDLSEAGGICRSFSPGRRKRLTGKSPPRNNFRELFLSKSSGTNLWLKNKKVKHSIKKRNVSCTFDFFFFTSLSRSKILLSHTGQRCPLKRSLNPQQHIIKVSLNLVSYGNKTYNDKIKVHFKKWKPDAT